MATIVDVAATAGVSTSTVSHVLNGTRNVRPATRRRVMAAVEKTGYRQDALARAMRRSRTDSIGLVLSDPSEPAFAEMIRGVERAAGAHGLTLLLAGSAERSEQELRAVQTLLERRVDGLILARSADPAAGLEPLLATAATPIVLLDRVVEGSSFDQVGADNRESMCRLATHLHRAGHRDIALLAGDVRVPTLRERMLGFRDAVGPEQPVLTGADPEEHKTQLAQLLDQRRVSCLVAASTPLAAVGLRAARQAGLRVPGDLAFATFDGFDHADLFEPSITTVRQPAAEMGEAAVRLLLERLENPDGAPRTVRLGQTVELRSSTETFTFVDA